MTKLDSEVDELIAACNGDVRGCVAALIMVNDKLEQELVALRVQIAGSCPDAFKFQHGLH